MDIILSHPFSGSLYAFFTEQERGEKIPEKIGHSYYETLYGKNREKFRALAVTQLLMYEKVFIVPADNDMPDSHQNFSDGKYENRELGLYTDWGVYKKSREQIERQVELDIKDPVISGILMKVPEYPRRQI